MANVRKTHVLVIVLALVTVCPAAEPQRLTYDGKLKLSPVFIAGSTEIVYSVHEYPTRVMIKRLIVSDGTQHHELPEGQASQFDAEFSRDQHYFVYSKSDTDRQLKLVIIDRRKGEEFVFFPPGTQRSTVRSPRILPDLSRVIFTLNGPGGQQIASVNLQAKDLQPLTTSDGTNGWPAVSPDGKYIVFSSSRAGPFDLYVMNADGSGTKRLTQSPASDFHASWSPDGKRIAFTSARDANYEIYVIGADGENLRRITHHPERDDFPIWHSDGEQLLTIAERDGEFDLYLTKID